MMFLIFAAALIADWQSLSGWRESKFKDGGAVRVEADSIDLARGKPLTGVTRTDVFPKSNYEIRFEAQRKEGNDFFASLTFPVKDSFATFVTGGWGGDIVGISSIDGWDASDNETRSYFTFENGRWYRFRLQITDNRIQAWIDDKSVVDVDIAGRKIDLRRGDIKLSTPLGFASYASAGAIKKIEYRELP